MNVKEIRKANLKALSNSIGGISALAERIGRSQSQISHIIGKNPVRNIGSRMAKEIEKAFDKPEGWLDNIHDNLSEQPHIDYGFLKNIPGMAPLIPVLDFKKAAMPKQVANPKGQPGLELADYDFVVLDSFTRKIGNYTFAIVAQDNSMQPEITLDDILVIDPDETIVPGDIVVAKLDSAEEVIIRKYRLKDNNTVELIPLNQDWPTTVITQDNPGRVIGKLIEKRQKY